MPIAFDATSAGQGASIVTVAHTCSGSNGLLFVMADSDSSHGSIVTARYGGIDLKFIDSLASDSNNFISFYYLNNPAQGANNILIEGSASNTNMEVSAASYRGAAQTGIPDNHATFSSVVTGNYSKSLTTTADNCWAIMAGIVETGFSVMGVSNTTVRQQPNTTYRGAFIVDSNSALTPPGSDTLNFVTQNAIIATCMATFAPSTIVNNNLSILRTG